MKCNVTSGNKDKRVETYVRLCYNHNMKKKDYFQCLTKWKEQKRIRSLLLLMMILFAAFAVLLFRNRTTDGRTAVITLDGQTHQTLSLNTDTLITVYTKDGAYNSIEVKDGSIKVLEADCANQTCVNTGSIHKNGEVIACIPHGLVITVVSPEEEVDTVAY